MGVLPLRSAWAGACACGPRPSHCCSAAGGVRSCDPAPSCVTQRILVELLDFVVILCLPVFLLMHVLVLHLEHPRPISVPHLLNKFITNGTNIISRLEFITHINISYCSSPCRCCIWDIEGFVLILWSFHIACTLFLSMSVCFCSSLFHTHRIFSLPL